jgi:hypothetical protein
MASKTSTVKADGTADTGIDPDPGAAWGPLTLVWINDGEGNPTDRRFALQVGTSADGFPLVIDLVGVREVQTGVTTV